MDHTATSSQPVIEIRPSRGLFDLDLRDLWRHRELLAVFIMRDIKVLYKQAALGIGWAVLQPVFAVTIFTIIFGFFARIPSEGVPYPLFAFSAMLPWTYFSEAVRRSGLGLVSDGELIRKIHFPRLVLPLSGVIAPMLDFAVAFAALMVLMVLFGVPPTWRILAVVPLVAATGLVALAVGLWLGPINVQFRDVKHTLPFMLQIWMYASPVIYPLSMIPEQWRWLYSLNPMVGVIECFRWAILDRGAPDPVAMAISGAVTVVILLSGLVFFKKMERSFADLI